MSHVDLPVDTPSHRNCHLITARLLFIHKTIGCVHKTRPRKGTRHSAFCKQLAITVSSMVLGAWVPCQEWKFFFIKRELHVNG